ncbi:predicted protein [Plenodomus lingam JN3]|uniref:Predicted protein n=1 Tax=Leptosphaeria maculans (strain JN3 / isolate v23.1.3 / race Av1-4-5-6-7-8) TaxID=985895 RepID=E4ZWU0_LEPMJ|nr:predicted protein [Plenodomus lingam JN3]CBX96066.1 predicted protein [Plenodomus lingam JN3]
MPPNEDKRWLSFSRKQEEERNTFHARVKEAEKLFSVRQQKEEQTFWKDVRKSGATAANDKRDVTSKSVTGGQTAAPVNTATTVPGNNRSPAKPNSTADKPPLRKTPKTAAPAIVDLCSDEEKDSNPKSVAESCVNNTVPKKRSAIRIPTATPELSNVKSTKIIKKKTYSLQEHHHGTPTPTPSSVPSAQGFGDAFGAYPGTSSLEDSRREPDLPVPRPRTKDKQPTGYISTAGISNTSVAPRRQQKPSYVALASTGHTKQSRINPAACSDELATPSPSLHSPAILTTPPTRNRSKPSYSASFRKGNGHGLGKFSSSETLASSPTTKSPYCSPCARSKRKILHNLSSSSDEDEMYEPSANEEDDEEQHLGHHLISPRPIKSPTKPPTKPTAKKPRVLNPSICTFAPARLDKSSKKPAKNPIVFKSSASETPQTLPATTAAAAARSRPTPLQKTNTAQNKAMISPPLSGSPYPSPHIHTQSRRAKVMARRRNQEFLRQLFERPISSSETAEQEDEFTCRDADSDDGLDFVGRERGEGEEENVPLRKRRLSITPRPTPTPAPSVISAADSTSARASLRGSNRSRQRAIADWMDWTRARLGGDREVRKRVGRGGEEGSEYLRWV